MTDTKEIRERARELAAAAPALSAERRERLRALLRPRTPPVGGTATPAA